MTQEIIEIWQIPLIGVWIPPWINRYLFSYVDTRTGKFYKSSGIVKSIAPKMKPMPIQSVCRKVPPKSNSQRGLGHGYLHQAPITRHLI